LLPNLHEVAGKKHGIQLAFQLLLDLPVREIRFFPLQQHLPKAEWTLLAERFSRLGVDCVLGNRMEDVALSVLVVGPVTLATYNSFREESKQELIASVLRLCTLDPHRISWLVHDAAREPRLGCETENSRLGVNSYLGEIEPWAVAKEVYL
jgi:predicted component of type VI protein secretion system